MSAKNAAPTAAPTATSMLSRFTKRYAFSNDLIKLKEPATKRASSTKLNDNRRYDDFSASAPATISRISFVMAACRVRL